MVKTGIKKIMKVILVQDIKNLGKKFNIKDVSDGYARNFLIPKGLVRSANEKNLKELEALKATVAKKEEKLKTQLSKLKKEIEKIEIEFKVAVGEKQQMFASVDESDIKEKIIEKFSSIEQFKEPLNYLKVILEKPIKKLGEHQVEINLGMGVKTKVKIVITPLAMNQPE